MAHSDEPSVSLMDRALGTELPELERIASEVGARTVSVLLLRSRTPGRIIYRWPEASEDIPVLPPLAHVAVEGGQLPGSIDSENPLAGLFGSLSPGARSFLLFCSGTRDPKAVVAFGFGEARAPMPGACCTVAQAGKLVALAVWCVEEVHSTRAQLATVTERLGGRKMVERAKAQLQAKEGMSEQEAYEYLRRLSRQRRVPMASVAKSLLCSTD